MKTVYRVRSETALTGPSEVASAAPTASQEPDEAPAPGAAGAPAAAETQAFSKAAFILSFPRSARARDIIAAGKKQGLSVSANYISVVRTGSRKKKGSKKAPASPKQTAVSAKSAPVAAVRAGASSVKEQALVGIILDIGLERVAGVVADVRKKLESLL